MKTKKRWILAVLVAGVFAVHTESQGSEAKGRWYAGTWDSTIYNRADHPRTVGIRLEIIDSETQIPVQRVQVLLRGKYWEEWVGSPVNIVGPLEPQEREFEIKAVTGEDGVVVFALGWQKEYPWRSYFGDHPPREYRKDGGYSVKQSWIRAVDDIEKVQRIEIRHPKHRYKEIPFHFRHLLEFEQDKRSEGQSPRIFDAFEEAWVKEIKRKNVRFCVLDLGTKFPDFQNKKCKRPEFFEKIRKEDWGTQYQKPYNWFSVGEHPQSECGPYFTYSIEDFPIERRTLEIELTTPDESETEPTKQGGTTVRTKSVPSEVASIEATRKEEESRLTKAEDEEQVLTTKDMERWKRIAEKDPLGITVETLTKNQRDRMRLPKGVQGVVIKYVLAGSGADKAGLKAGQVIDSIMHRVVANKIDYDGHLQFRKSGDQVLVGCWQKKWWRKWKRGTVSCYTYVSRRPELVGKSLDISGMLPISLDMIKRFPALETIAGAVNSRYQSGYLGWLLLARDESHLLVMDNSSLEMAVVKTPIVGSKLDRVSVKGLTAGLYGTFFCQRGKDLLVYSYNDESDRSILEKLDWNMGTLARFELDRGDNYIVAPFMVNNETRIRIKELLGESWTDYAISIHSDCKKALACSWGGELFYLDSVNGKINKIDDNVYVNPDDPLSPRWAGFQDLITYIKKQDKHPNTPELYVANTQGISKCIYRPSLSNDKIPYFINFFITSSKEAWATLVTEEKHLSIVKVKLEFAQSKLPYGKEK